LKELKSVLTGESLEPEYADFLHVEDDDSDHSKVSMVLVLYCRYHRYVPGILYIVEVRGLLIKIKGGKI
jgi:hypothetical protein